MLFNLRLLDAIPGVPGLLPEPRDSLSVSNDGMDSVDTERTEDDGPSVVLLSKLPISDSPSSGGLRSMPHDWGLEEEMVRLGC